MSDLGPYNRIDARLEDMDGAACVSRFYSDSENIVIMCDLHIKNDVVEIAKGFGLSLYDIGGIDASVIMMTFKTNAK